MTMTACKGISPGATSLAEKLRDEAGYRAHFVGKWHVGHATLSYTPWARGFDSSYGFFANGVDHFTKCSYQAPDPANKSAATWCKTLGRHSTVTLYDWFEHQRGAPLDEATYISPAHAEYSDTYLTHLHQDRARQIVLDHNATEGPLFLFFAFAAVHSPLQATPELLTRVDALRSASYFAACDWFDWGEWPNPMPRNPLSPIPHVPGEEPTATCSVHERRLLEAMALAIDDAVGVLVDAVRQRGMWDNTLLVFVSDNGGAINQQGSNLPLRGGKLGGFEGGVRVPGLLAGGWLPAGLHGRSYAGLVHMADWWPTLSHAAGLAASDDRSRLVPAVDGSSMWHAWLTNSSAPRTLVLSRHMAIVQVVDSGSAQVTALHKLSTADLELCATRRDWALEACGPPPVNESRRQQLEAEHTGVLGGWGERCTWEAPCLFDVLSDEREEHLLNVADHAEAVLALQRSINDSLVPTADPFYPESIVCPDHALYGANGDVRQPAPVWTLVPPRPPMPPPKHRGFRYLPQPPPVAPSPQPPPAPTLPPAQAPPAASPPSPPPCLGRVAQDDEAAVALNFSAAFLVHSNLGGQGGQGSQPAGTPPSIRFGGLGILPDGRSVDLVVSNTSRYNAWDARWNGLKTEGRSGSMGCINQIAPRDSPPSFGLQSTSTSLRFAFIDSLTSAPVTIGLTHLSFLDFDEASDERARECLTLPGADEVTTERSRSRGGGFEPQVSVSLTTPTQLEWNASTSTYCATQQGNSRDNPLNPASMNAVQRARSLMLTIRNRSHVDITFSLYGCCFTGRSLLFAGRSDVLPDCANEPSPSPSLPLPLRPPLPPLSPPLPSSTLSSPLPSPPPPAPLPPPVPSRPLSHLCDPSPCAASAAPLAGPIAHTTVNSTLALSGATHTVSGQPVYGPFAAGMGPWQASLLSRLGCTGLPEGLMLDGIDTRTAEHELADACGIALPHLNGHGARVALLDACGGQVMVGSEGNSSEGNYHLHERFSCLYDGEAVGHSTQVARGTNAALTPIYGKWEDRDRRRLPVLDACGAHFGVTPDSRGALVYHHHVSGLAPFTVGCYGPSADAAGSPALVSVAECRGLYSECGDGDTVELSTGALFDPWCPCFDEEGSNVDLSARPSPPPQPPVCAAWLRPPVCDLTVAQRISGRCSCQFEWTVDQTCPTETAIWCSDDER